MIKEEAIIRNLKINYFIFGEGKPLLVLHGWGSRSERWQKVAEILSQKGFKVIVPDLPGFGESQKPDFIWGLDEYCSFVNEFAKSLNLNQFYLVGHSFGGSLAVKYALKFPARVEKLFLVGAACIRRKSLKKSLLRFLSKLFRFLRNNTLIKKAFYKFIVKSDYLQTQGIMRDIYLKIIKQDLSSELEKISIPTIIIWGEKDNVMPLKFGKLINNKIKDSKLIIISGGYHDLEIKMPEELTNVILNGVKDLVVAGRDSSLRSE